MTAVPANTWNGPCLTSMRTLQSVNTAGERAGTQVIVGGNVTSPHMVAGVCKDFPAGLCVTNFATHKDKLVAPFRGTFKGTIVDLLATDYSQNGNMFRQFKLVDPNGYYIECCATRHNASSVALVNNVEVIRLFAIARPPLSNARSALFVMKDGLVVPIEPKTNPPVPTTQIQTNSAT